jgi:iron(III) transport system substrate-binding protein
VWSRYLHRRQRAASLAIVAVVAMGCAGGSSSSPAEPGDLDDGRQDSTAPPDALNDDDQDRADRLLAAARDEGEVTWYTSLAGPVVTALTDAFTEAYPDIDLVVFRSPQTDLVARLVQEHAAGRVEADVLETNQDAATLLAEEGILTGFRTPLADDRDPRWVVTGPDDTVLMVANRVSYNGFAYNTELLDAAEVPGTVEDLLDPELAPRLAVTTSTTGVRWVGNVLTALGEEAGRELLVELGRAGLRLEAVSGAGLADLIASGEVAASPAVFRNHVLALQAEGAPVEWVPLEPVLGNVGVVALPDGGPNPNAGLLLAEFLLGPEGERVLSENLYPSPDEDLGFEVWISDEDFATASEQQAAFEIWQDTFDEAFG